MRSSMLTNQADSRSFDRSVALVLSAQDQAAANTTSVHRGRQIIAYVIYLTPRLRSSLCTLAISMGGIRSGTGAMLCVTQMHAQGGAH